MGIESTRYITREDAIDRIEYMSSLFIDKCYRQIEEEAFDPDFDVQEFVDSWVPIDTSNLENWTDEMLGNYMDNSFFRYSMFENYLVEEG